MGKLSKKAKAAALAEIAAEIAVCKKCKVKKIGVSVPGEGDADADVVFVGEAPGKNEAVSGKPFIGRAGKVLRALIADAGLRDADVFITSAVKYLPEYVTPTLADIEHGRTHLFAQLDIIQPKIIVLLGNTAAVALLDHKISIAKDHGTIIQQDGRTYLVAYHPAAPLYSPKLRTEIAKDFAKLKALLSP